MRLDLGTYFSQAIMMKLGDAILRALEQIVIEKNWVERKLLNGTEWRCGWSK
jgi:hypothetical protein